MSSCSIEADEEFVTCLVSASLGHTSDAAGNETKGTRKHASQEARRTWDTGREIQRA